MSFGSHVGPVNVRAIEIAKKRNLRILTINCRSIKDKTSELKTTIDYTKPDIISSMHDLWCHMSQQSQHTPSFFNVTGRSHIPQGKILLCLGPGLSSISPASNIVIRITEVFLLFFTGSCIGLCPGNSSVSEDTPRYTE
jgi:hypothetical protein